MITDSRTRRSLIAPVALMATAGSVFRGFRSAATQTVTPHVRVLVPDIAFRELVLSLRDEFARLTGVQVIVVPMPAESVYFALNEDARSGSDDLDCAIVPEFHLGDLLTNEVIIYLDELADNAPATLQPNSQPAELSATARLRQFGGRQIAVPIDGDCLLLYCRNDLLSDPDHQRAYQLATGQALTIPATWDDLESIGSYFGDFGLAPVTVPLAAGGPGFRHYLGIAAPYVLGSDNPGDFWFDPMTFAPLLTGPGHLAALELLSRLVSMGPVEQLEWSPFESWSHFVDGGAVFALAGPDAMASVSALSPEISARIAVGHLPGIAETIGSASPVVRSCGNTLGVSWGGVVRSTSENPSLSMEFLALLSSTIAALSPAELLAFRLAPSDLGHLPAEIIPDGGSTIDAWSGTDLTEAQTTEFARAVQQTLSNPIQLPPLRVPGSLDYYSAIGKGLRDLQPLGSSSAVEILEHISAAFQEITARHGPAQQLARYLQSQT